VLGGNPSTPEVQKAVRDAGGLYVIGTERHESRRIDNQLRGRSGRQGDPGETRFYVSTEDDLMRIFSSDRVRSVMDTLKIDENTPIESKMIMNSLEKAQQRVEGHNFDARKRVLEYDDVLNKHRTSTYERRRQILMNDAFDVETDLKQMIESEVERVVLFHTGDVTADVPEQFRSNNQQPNFNNRNWDPNEILEVFRTILPTTPAFDEFVKKELREISRDKEVLATQRTAVIEALMAHATEQLVAFKESVGSQEMLNRIGRAILLRTIDNAWISHLETMTYLRRSIGLRGYGQRDPLVEYKREGFGIYNAMQESIEREVVYNIFKVLHQSVAAQQMINIAPSILEKAQMTLQGAQKVMGGTGKTGGEGEKVESTTVTNESAFANVGRNEPCPCESGKKFKKCHGA